MVGLGFYLTRFLFPFPSPKEEEAKWGGGDGKRKGGKQSEGFASMVKQSGGLSVFFNGKLNLQNSTQVQKDQKNNKNIIFSFGRFFFRDYVCSTRKEKRKRPLFPPFLVYLVFPLPPSHLDLAKTQRGEEGKDAFTQFCAWTSRLVSPSYVVCTQRAKGFLKLWVLN